MCRQDGNYLGGNILGFLKLLKDNHLDINHIMEKKEREAFLALPEAKEYLTSYELVNFMDRMPGGFLIYFADGDEEIIYANQATRQMFQCETVEEFQAMTGNSFRGMVHPEDIEAVEESIQAQIGEGQGDLDYVEYRIIRKDGTARWIEDYGHYVPSEDFRDIFYVFLTDATEKRSRRDQETQRLQNLMEAYDKEWTLINQEHLRRLEVIEGLSVNYETIFYVDLEKGLIMPYRLSVRSGPIFDQELQTLKYTQVISDYINRWVHPEDRAMFSKATDLDGIREKLAGNKSYYSNYRVLNGAEEQYLQMRVVNVGHQEQTTQIVMGFRRVDEEIQTEMKQKQLLAEALENANRAIGAKSTFLSNMSHDMRTPLNAIFGFSTLAKRNCNSPEIVLEYLDRIEASSRQLLDLINKVLELSQTESGDMRTVEEECNLCDILQEVYDFLLPQSVEKDMEFILDFSQITHREIYADEEKLRQLVMYLANNAVTYTKSGGRVSITASELEELPNQFAVYQLVVEDNGIGISKEFIEHIFEPFAREKNTTLSGIHGIGLGLTIAKNIVDMMDGTIEVQSEVGQGSTFIIHTRFRYQSQEAETSQAEDQDEAVQGNGQRILLVEDNEINLEIETELLEEMGFVVEPAENGSIAVEKLQQSAPGTYDLVLMDIQMPVMDGWQAARAIRRMSDPVLARIPIIALSANVFESDMRKSKESGMDAHLPKPLDIMHLLETIKEVLRRRLN